MSTQAHSSLPVKRVVLHAKVVAGEVPGWVAQVVKLVPEHSLGARRGGYDSGLHGETDRGEDGLTRCGGLGRRGHTFSSTSYHNTISCCPDSSRGFAGEGEDILVLVRECPMRRTGCQHYSGLSTVT